MRILLSSVGRRGYLVKFFREAIAPGDEIFGGDNSKYAPALAYCDQKITLPKVTETDYVDKLLEYSITNKIDIIVPLIDPELEILATRRVDFDQAGIMVAVSPIETINKSFDKFLTYRFGIENSIPVPQTFLEIPEAEKALSDGQLTWPVVVKSRKGSASQNIFYCDDRSQLASAFERCPLPMIQEFVKGSEYGLDIFSDQDYKPISVFCKLKLQMRAGETDKAVSVSDPELIDMGKKIAESLPIFGPADIDILVDQNGPKLLEINPRFGGGYPCSHHCGAEFPAKLLKMRSGEKLTPDIGSCPDGLYMFKQDEIIVKNKSELDSIEEISFPES